MIFTTTSFGKMPVAVQAILGLVLLAFGALMMGYAQFWSQGDIRFLILFLSVGVLYLLNGVPTLIEGFMTMYYKKEPKETFDAPA